MSRSDDSGTSDVSSPGEPAHNSNTNSRTTSPAFENEHSSPRNSPFSPLEDLDNKNSLPETNEKKGDIDIKVDENGEIDLDALFAGDLDEVMDMPLEEQKEGFNADNEKTNLLTVQATEKNSEKHVSEATDPLFDEAPESTVQPTTNDSNNVENDPLLNVEFPAEAGVPYGQEQVYQTKEEAERERMKLLVSHFDEQQMARYAAYRRANIRRASIKKFASQLLNQPITNSVALVLGGMSKVLIGDIIELARDLQDKEEAAERKRRNLPEPLPGTEPEPLLPSYIREAWSIYKRDTRTVPGCKTKLGSMNRTF